MNKRIISPTFFVVKSRDKIGGTIRANVYIENSLYKAYSMYTQDKEEEIVSYWEDEDEEIAIKQSRKELRKEWKNEKLRTKELVQVPLET